MQRLYYQVSVSSVPYWNYLNAGRSDNMATYRFLQLGTGISSAPDIMVIRQLLFLQNLLSQTGCAAWKLLLALRWEKSYVANPALSYTFQNVFEWLEGGMWDDFVVTYLRFCIRIFIEWGQKTKENHQFGPIEDFAHIRSCNRTGIRHQTLKSWDAEMHSNNLAGDNHGKRHHVIYRSWS